MKILIFILLLSASVFADCSNCPMGGFVFVTNERGEKIEKWAISIDTGRTAYEAFAQVAKTKPFGLFDPVTGEMPNEPEMLGYIFCMRLATGALNHSRIYGVLYRDKHHNNYEGDSQKNAYAAIDVLLDTFRNWLDANPKEMEKYIALTMNKRLHPDWCDRSVGQLDYPSFSRELAKRMVTVDAVNPEEWINNTTALLEKWRVMAVNPERCQQAELDDIKQRKNMETQKERTKVNPNRTSIFQEVK